jgi:DNA-binding HxlR family transcriptional regulator
LGAASSARASPLILRDVWVGINRFDQLQQDLGISSKVLTERLKWLTEQGVLERRAYQERPQRFEYVLTEKGSELCAVLMAMTAWGDKHLAALRASRSCCATRPAATTPGPRSAARTAARR